MRSARAFALFLCLASSAAQAGERSYTVTDFDRIRVIGPFVVELETGKSPSVRATGSGEALDRVNVSVVGQMLVIKPDSSAWRGWSGKPMSAAHIKVSGHMLRSASLEGSGGLSISAMRGQQLTLGVTGSGSMSIAKLETDRLKLSLYGDGALKVSGSAKIADANARGGGSITAAELKTSDLIVSWHSAGNFTGQAARSAKLTSTGSGSVTVTGTNNCIVNTLGAGAVNCAVKASLR